MNDKLLATTPSKKNAGALINPVGGLPLIAPQLIALLWIVSWNIGLLVVTDLLLDWQQLDGRRLRGLARNWIVSNICGLLTMLCAKILFHSRPQWSCLVAVCGVLFSFLWYVTVLLETGIIDDGES